MLLDGSLLSVLAAYYLTHLLCHKYNVPHFMFTALEFVDIRLSAEKPRPQRRGKHTDTSSHPPDSTPAPTVEIIVGKKIPHGALIGLVFYDAFDILVSATLGVVAGVVVHTLFNVVNFAAASTSMPTTGVVYYSSLALFFYCLLLLFLIQRLNTPSDELKMTFGFWVFLAVAHFVLLTFVPPQYFVPGFDEAVRNFGDLTAKSLAAFDIPALSVPSFVPRLLLSTLCGGVAAFLFFPIVRLRRVHRAVAAQALPASTFYKLLCWVNRYTPYLLAILSLPLLHISVSESIQTYFLVSALLVSVLHLFCARFYIQCFLRTAESAVARYSQAPPEVQEEARKKLIVTTKDTLTYVCKIGVQFLTAPLMLLCVVILYGLSHQFDLHLGALIWNKSLVGVSSSVSSEILPSATVILHRAVISHLLMWIACVWPSLTFIISVFN